MKTFYPYLLDFLSFTATMCVVTLALYFTAKSFDTDELEVLTPVAAYQIGELATRWRARRKNGQDLQKS